MPTDLPPDYKPQPAPGPDTPTAPGGPPKPPGDDTPPPPGGLPQPAGPDVGVPIPGTVPSGLLTF